MDLPWQKFYSDKQLNIKLEDNAGLYGKLKEVCLKYPKRIAFEYDKDQYTYSRLLEFVDSASVFLRDSGIEEGAKVALLVRGIPASILSTYALERIGAITSMIHSEVKEYRFIELMNLTKSQIAIMTKSQFDYFSNAIKQTKIKLVILCSETDYKSPLRKAASIKSSRYISPLENCKILLWNDKVSRKSADEDFNYEDRDHTKPSFIFINGLSDMGVGTFGISSTKINNATIINSFLYDEVAEELGRPVRVLTATDRCYLYGMNHGMHTVFMTGNTLCLCDKYDGIYPKKRISFFKPDVYNAFPSLVTHMAEASHLQNLDFGFLKRVYIGSGNISSFSRSSGERFLHARNSKCDIYEIHCLGETQNFLYSSPSISNQGASGIPMPEVLVKVINPDSYYEMPEGEMGIIAVCSPVLCDDLNNTDSKEKNRIIKMRDGRNWFLTDLYGSKDSNGLFVLKGNSNRRVEIAGSYAYPEVVDDIISKVQGVVECCTVVIYNEYDIPQMIAEVIPKEEYLFDNNKLSELRDDIMKECEMMIPPHMCPSDVEFRVYFPKNIFDETDYSLMAQKVAEEHKTDDLT